MIKFTAGLVNRLNTITTAANNAKALKAKTDIRLRPRLARKAS